MKYYIWQKDRPPHDEECRVVYDQDEIPRNVYLPGISDEMTHEQIVVHRRACPEYNFELADQAPSWVVNIVNARIEQEENLKDYKKYLQLQKEESEYNHLKRKFEK